MYERDIHLMEQFSRIINRDGDPSDLGCHGTVEELLVRSQAIFPGVPACVVSDWVWLDIDMSEAMIMLLRSTENLQPAMLYSGCVQFDKKGRCGQGSVIRSSYLTQFMAPCFFRTRNTLYVMQGTGVRLSVDQDVIASMRF